MLSIIIAVLNLWDPYSLYLFPEDEYLSYALQIEEFIKSNDIINEVKLAQYVYKIIPPIEQSYETNAFNIR